MKALADFLKNHIWKVTTVAFLLLFLNKGCVNNRISNLEKQYLKNTTSIEHKLDSLSNICSKTADKKEVRDQMERVMFDFLIYEDDIDKKKISLSEIKDKIESNDGK